MGRPNRAVNPRQQSHQRPLAERLRLAREITAYRAAHPTMLLSDVLDAMGLADSVKQSNYYAWRARLELADAVRKSNGAAQSAPEPAASVEHFPIELIPPRPAKSRPRPVNDHAEDDRKLAAMLLEVAARLLKR